MSGFHGSTHRSGTADITRRLAEICGPSFARPAGPADEVAGRLANWVAVPGDARAAAEVLRLAAAHDLTVVPRGAGTKIDWGAPPDRVDVMLDTGRLAGIRVPAEPGSTAASPARGGRHRRTVGQPGRTGSVVEVGAGTPLRAVQAVLERTGHRLALDAPSPGATVGGVLATEEAGPLRLRYGTPGDQLVNLRYLTADGDLVDTDGEVTGAELAGLLCGSHGGLGVLVSATLRARPLPPARAWVTRGVWTPLEVHELIRAILAANLRPAAIELDLPAGHRPPSTRAANRGATWVGHPAGSARAAHPAGSGRAVHPSGLVPSGRRRAAGPPAAGDLVVLLEGGAADVAERARLLTGLLGDGATVADSPPPWWRRYPFRPDDIALRVDVPLTDLYAAIYALRDAVGAPVPVRGSVGLGVAHAVLPGDTPVDRVSAILTAVRQVLLGRQGRCVLLAGPPAVRQGVDIWGGAPVPSGLRAAKQHLDPHRRLAPGRLPGGL